MKIPGTGLKIGLFSIISLIAVVVAIAVTWQLSNRADQQAQSTITPSGEELADQKQTNTGAKTISTDRFGIAMLSPTVSGGREWYSNWDDGAPREIQSGNSDPHNSELFARGNGYITIDGKGVATLTGTSPRMYVYDPTYQNKWNNVEVTFYAMSKDNSETYSYSGLMAYVRTDHTNQDNDRCGNRGYGGRLLYDGRADFEKEINHHTKNGYDQRGVTHPWGDGNQMPTNVWIGYKFVARNIDSKFVKLELYVEKSGLKQGTKESAQWEKISEYVDDGHNWGSGATPCGSGVSPTDALLYPNLSVYIRDDGANVTTFYKDFSIREVAPIGNDDKIEATYSRYYTDDPSSKSTLDTFGIKKVYPTKAGGRSWYMDSEDPESDSIFNPQGKITQSADKSSWFISMNRTRMLVDGIWRDVEITGYVKLKDILPGGSASNDAFSWYARGGLHTLSDPCQGSAMKGNIVYDGSSIHFRKELYHLGEDNGYNEGGRLAEVRNPTSTSLLDRWVGFKVIMYNSKENATKMEAWLDRDADNHWQLISQFVDDGHVQAKLKAPCDSPLTGRPLQLDDVILWQGRYVTFRADHSSFYFKNLSVREIQVPG